MIMIILLLVVSNLFHTAATSFCSARAPLSFRRPQRHPRRKTPRLHDPGPSSVNWAIWRPVLAGLDTLTNVKYSWSIDDLMDSHEALDIQHETEQAAYERAK